MRVLKLIAVVLLLALPAACSMPGTAPDAVGSPTAPQETAGAVEEEPAAAPPALPSLTEEQTAEAMPVAAADPAGLAAQLVDAERTVRAPGSTDGDLRRAGHLQQTAYRMLARHAEWRDDVLGRVPEPLRGAVRANADAVADLIAMITPLPAGSRPGWQIVAPLPAEELLGHYREAAEAFGVGWEYLAAIHLVETRLGRIRGTSSAGAQGPMQFMPGTWAQYGEGDVDDDRDAIMAAGRYLKAMGAPGNMDRALRRYNNSARYVRAIQGHAAVLRVEPDAYRGYYHWQVHYLTQEGDLWLPEGYPDRPAVVPPA